MVHGSTSVLRQTHNRFEVIQIRGHGHPDTLDTDTKEKGLTNLLLGTAIGRGSVIASTPHHLHLDPICLGCMVLCSAWAREVTVIHPPEYLHHLSS